jgi:acyl-CoA thioesterase FadM
MFVRNYRVKGEDVNDFMVMQNFAYLSYSSKIIEAYLLENGFSQLKLNALQIGWQKSNDHLRNKKHLMFAKNFTARLNFGETTREKAVTAFIDFYDDQQELVATLTTELTWFDYEDWTIVSPPQQIDRLFPRKTTLRRAV